MPTAPGPRPVSPWLCATPLRSPRAGGSAAAGTRTHPEGRRGRTAPHPCQGATRPHAQTAPPRPLPRRLRHCGAGRKRGRVTHGRRSKARGLHGRRPQCMHNVRRARAERVRAGLATPGQIAPRAKAAPRRRHQCPAKVKRRALPGCPIQIDPRLLRILAAPVRPTARPTTPTAQRRPRAVRRLPLARARNRGTDRRSPPTSSAPP